MNIVYKGAAYCLSSLLAGGGALLNPALTLALAVVRQVAIISLSLFISICIQLFFLLIVAILSGKALQPVQLSPLLPSATCPDTRPSYR